MSSIYEKYGLKQVINTSGRMTILGVSTPRQDVIDAVDYGLNHYFEIKDLVNKTGAYIADLLNVEDAVIVSCASAGIAQSVAAVIVKDNANLLVNLHSAPVTVPREIVLPRGHNVNFGAPVDTMVALGGGKVVEAGYANECSPEQIEACITPQTAAILYVKSHHCVQKSILSVEQAAVVARKHNLPLIVDAAAEEDLHVLLPDGGRSGDLQRRQSHRGADQRSRDRQETVRRVGEVAIRRHWPGDEGRQRGHPRPDAGD
jgi:L-seryl-tRNA(Ser) seleniumtransferase